MICAMPPQAGRLPYSTPERRLRLRRCVFTHNTLPCGTHSRSVYAKSAVSAAIESPEYGVPLLPDHTSTLAALDAISRQVAALSPDIATALQLISDHAFALTRASGAAIALSGGENMICRASSGSDAPPIE